MPVTADWSAAPDFLQLIIDHCLASKPTTIVECSSGVTTLVLARCCQLNGAGYVYSLENGEKYVGRTRHDLADFVLGDYASVLHAPLVKQTVAGNVYQWYGYDEHDLSDRPVDMLVIDGPSGFIQKNSRYPALAMLYSLFNRVLSQR